MVSHARSGAECRKNNVRCAFAHHDNVIMGYTGVHPTAATPAETDLNGLASPSSCCVCVACRASSSLAHDAHMIQRSTTDV